MNYAPRDNESNFHQNWVKRISWKCFIFFFKYLLIGSKPPYTPLPYICIVYRGMQKRPMGHNARLAEQKQRACSIISFWTTTKIAICYIISYSLFVILFLEKTVYKRCYMCIYHFVISSTFGKWSSFWPPPPPQLPASSF